MPAELFTPPSRALDANADPYAGALLYAYATGTTTPQAVYTTSALATPHANPVVADAGGKFAPIYFDASLTYRVVIKNSTASVTLHDLDPVNTGTLTTLAASGGSALVGFLQAGTGAVARTAQAKMRDVLHAADFGVAAAASWAASSDQTAKLQAAINEAKATWRELILPHGIIRVDSALDCTGMFAGGLTIRGAGFGSPNAGTGTVILANTGGTVFDFTGSQWCSIEDVVIDGIVFSPPTPSRIGIVYARATTSLYCQFNALRNVQIKLPTSIASNGGTGSYGIVNLTGEIHNYHNLIVHADNCVACLATKPAWLSSTFKTIDNSITSMSVVNFSGFTSFTGLNTTRPAFRAESLKACSFDMLYTVGDGTTAMDLEGVEQLTIRNGSFEGHSFVAAILRNGCKNIDINYYSGGTPTAPLQLGSAFSSVSWVTFRATYNAGWTRVVERGNVGNVLTGVNLYLAGDTGTVSTSNLTNITGVYRPIRLSGSTTTDVASIANSAQASFDVTVTGVALDGTWVCRVATSADPGALGISAIVRAANTVRVTLVNNSGGAIDPASLTYTVLAERLS